LANNNNKKLNEAIGFGADPRENSVTWPALALALVPTLWHQTLPGTRAFSSEVDTGSRKENASKQEARASVLIQSEPIML
jgi:hypothetical protein